MKKQLLALLLSTSVIGSAWSQQTCPLTNARLTDLRTAASKLAKTITLSAECQSYQTTVNQANNDLKNIALQIKAAEEKKSPETAKTDKVDSTQLAIAAVTQLDTINTVFKDPKCGQQLASFLDYADAFVDVVVGMTPFLALYGGSDAAPWVLGPALGGAAAKALISFFKNKAVNMRNPDQSNAFIKNSCAFYNLNTIKNSIDEVQLNQTPRIELEMKMARTNLKEMVKIGPVKPSNRLAKDLALAEKDQVRLKTLQEQMQVDSTEGCTYLNAYLQMNDKTEADSSMLERVWNNYEKVSEASFKLDLEKNYFQSDLTNVMSNDATKCATLGNKWLKKMTSFNDAALVVFRKAADEDQEVKNFRGWTAEKEKQELLIKALEGRLKFFNDMMGQGFSIEYSEIIRSHEQVQDALFQSYHYLSMLKMRGLAEAWLRVKYEDADARIDEFKDRKEQVIGRIEKIQKILGVTRIEDISKDSVNGFAQNYMSKMNREHPSVTKSVLIDVCNQLRMTWTAWYNGLIHARAGRDYCVSFDNVINKLDYPEVQNMCFGSTHKNGKKINSLKNQVVEIQQKKVEADQIVRYMDQFGCRRGDDTTPELLALPIQ